MSKMVKKSVLTDLDVVVLVVNVCVLPLSPANSLLVQLGHQIVHFYVTLPDLLFLQIVLLVVFLPFLLVRVFVIDSVIEILVVQLFIVPVEFSNSRVEANHQILVCH